MLFYEQVRLLHDNELWSNLIHVAPVITSMIRSGSPAVPSSSPELHHMTVFLADAFFESKEYSRAEALYKESLQFPKPLGTKCNHLPDPKAVSDVEVKYKLHLCYMRTGQKNRGIEALESIPAKQRTPKVNQALGQVYQAAGMERSAVACFREVLKSCPVALEAAQVLLSLGTNPKDIQSFALEVTAHPGMEWFNQWVQAFALVEKREYSQAVVQLRQLEEQQPPVFRNSVQILVALGQCQYHLGDHTGALATLQRAHRLEPCNLRGMDVLAALLGKERRLRELEALATRLMAVTEEAPEPWIATGHYCYANRKGTKAIYFAHRACMLQHRNVEALILKGNVLLDMKKHQDAMQHFSQAEFAAPHRFEAHRGLVDCYLAQSRHREAVGVATSACKALNNSARSLTLLASVLVKDPLQLSGIKAKGLLEKALRKEPNHLPAVYLLAKIWEQESNYEAAIQLLSKQLAVHSSSKLHQMMADLLGKVHQDEKAMEHYTTALNLNPKNNQAQEGLQKLEQATDVVSDRTFEVDREENWDEAELEESETEAVWSDGDLNLTVGGNASF